VPTIISTTYGSLFGFCFVFGVHSHQEPYSQACKQPPDWWVS